MLCCVVPTRFCAHPAPLHQPPAPSHAVLCCAVLSPSGSVHTLPRFTSPKVRSMLDMPDLKAYSDLASAYGNDNPDKLLRVAEQHMTTFSNVSHAIG